ncbi:C3 and PZP-like alpha-2-macroglobulin domain-containing protein 8 [Holothuria leucospilota]|uniref:C3 and PZP-like alpha-2-macroglobulin domain-containing protein 8 n=1 Tax=Holothuria leucospilota TaxID=206669 RepID=A0A9Q1HBV1_HOLLE|nr:C3 and PZP-like alpha-2-macroglobulin domain-containing protein 8 [Holothuria leucospilota]
MSLLLSRSLTWWILSTTFVAVANVTISPTCPVPLEYNTDTTYYYRYLEIPLVTNLFEFEAKANNDVHIALSPSQSSSDLYEIVIGGWRNTQSVIRRCKQCENQVTVSTIHYLSANEYRRFWITFDSNGAVAVGRNDESTPFMEWTDPAPLDVQYLGYSTCCGSSGEFRFCGLTPTCPMPLEYNTDTTYYYRYLEIPLVTNLIEFEAKANNDVHIALSPSQSSSDLYEIVIGGWRNTQSVIRRCKQCENQVTVSTIHYLSANEYRRFWITFDRNGAVAVGRNDKSTPFMEWTDPAPLDVKYLGYSTCCGSSGEFRFCGLTPTCPVPLEYNTDTTYYYRYLEIPLVTNLIEFEAKANNDVHIALSPSQSSSDLYEIVIGGWRNTQSVIRRCKQCENQVTVSTIHYLSANEYRRFWITFDSNGAVAVGRNDESTPFMEWTDPVPLDVQYLGYSTCCGSSGEFRFCGLTPTCPVPLEYNTDTTYYYRYLEIPLVNNLIEFEAKANNDVHIALSPSQSSSDLYEIVIGGWRNTQSVIRRCKQCENQFTVSTIHYLSANEYRRFWITFDSNGAVAVGRNDESTPFMEWTDPVPLDVQYLGYSTCCGSSGEFRFCGLTPTCPVPLEYNTDTTYYYRYLEIPLVNNLIEFEAKANNDVHIALSPSQSSSDLYEIVIGGWRNTQSVIRRCKQCENQVTVSTIHYLSANEYRRFWITFDSNGAVAVGRNDESTPFMEWTDPVPLDVQYLGYSTCCGSSGEFRFCGLTPTCPVPLEYNTDTTYYYRYLEIPLVTNLIEFEAKANNDVHIALSPSQSSSDLYEIVIGGWRNTQSVIRRCKQCENQVTVSTIHYLSANEYRRFWITFDSNGAVAVGRNDESTPFMQWTDPVPLDVQYLGYSTCCGSSGEFRFCGLTPTKCHAPLEYNTDTTYYYRYLESPLVNNLIEFEAKANNDVHIALSPSQSSSDLYEIVIGGWENTQSVIRRCKQCENQVTVSTIHYLSANEYRRFWITFDSNGAVAVGRNDESTPFMEWTDPVPLDVQYLGYSTCCGSSGQFRFCGLGVTIYIF